MDATETVNVKRRKVIVEPAGDGFGCLLMWENGQVIWRRDPGVVLQTVEKADRETVRRTTGLDGCVTEIEWRNFPEGFKPPRSAATAPTVPPAKEPQP